MELVKNMSVLVLKRMTKTSIYENESKPKKKTSCVHKILNIYVYTNMFCDKYHKHQWLNI